MRSIFTLFILLLFFHFANGQVSITPEPSWIVKEDYNPEASAPENGVNGGAQVLLYTEQVHIDLEEAYVKSTIKAIEYSGIQNISDVVAHYDPSYQKLRFHTIEVIRNGTSINKLSYQEIQTARRETNAENFIYDGTITAFVNIPDVRIGDVVSYSYSIKGFNPIQKGVFSTSFVLNSTQAIDRLAIHVFGKKELNHQIINADVEVNHRVAQGVHHYEWSVENVPAMLLDENSPSWYIQNAMVMVSEYESWSDVIAWGEDIFSFKEPLNEQLQTITTKIKNAYSTEGERIIAALAFVQNEIRYLATHSGIGGYKPNAPNKVITQRFGDCKDKSVLLTAMLNAMDIEAYPTLVNTSLGQILPTLSPSSKLFDHCIVKVVDSNSKVLWYDPTLTDQGGNYSNVYLPDYRYGLVLDKNMAAMDTISNFRNNMVETFSTFKLNEMGKGAELEVRTHYHEGEADFMRAIFRNNNKELLAKELLKFYAETYGSIAAIEPPTVIDDSLKNEFALLERYKLDSIWRPSVENPSNMTLSIYPTNLTQALIMPNKLQRTAPFALAYPMVRKQNVKIILPERIAAKSESATINSDFFYYDYNSKYDRKSNVLTLDYYYKSQDDHVPVSKFDDYYRDMVQLDSKIGYLVIFNKNSSLFSSSTSSSTSDFFLYGLMALFILVLVIGIIIVSRQKRNV